MNASGSEGGSSTEAGASGSEGDVNFGFRGVIILQLGDQEIGRVPVYTPGQLPPETSPYVEKYNAASASAYPAGTWLQAFGSALRALFHTGNSEAVQLVRV